MWVIEPIAMTNGQLLSSNVTEDDYAEWDVATTYAAEARVIVIGTTHKVYESVQGSNTGNDPITDAGTWWVEISATNRWKAFDARIADQVTNSGTITYSIKPDTLVTGIVLLNLAAAEARVQISDLSGTEVYDTKIDLVDDVDIIDWFTFFTTALGFETEALFENVPGYSGYQINITVGDGGGSPEVGEIVLGLSTKIGATLSGSRTGIEDFSTKERDDFGNAIILERAFIDETTFQIALPNRDVRRTKRLLSRLRATPSVYYGVSGSRDFGELVYGFFQEFDIPLESAGRSIMSIEIEGLS